MKTLTNKHKKRRLLGASVLLATTAMGCSALNSISPAQSLNNVVSLAQQIGTPETASTTLPLQATATTVPNQAAAGAAYYDGQYYGDAFSADHWGQMQVVAVIENGQLTDILIADYPHSTNRSVLITQNALPTLISEAIQAQSANIDFVSRATDSSRAFIQSLDSALEDASIGVDL